MHIDFNAPIVACRTAAGFDIGCHLEDYEADFAGAQAVQYYEGFNLVEEINRNSGVLRIDKFGDTEGPSIYFGPDTVRLVFGFSVSPALGFW